MPTPCLIQCKLHCKVDPALSKQLSQEAQAKGCQVLNTVPKIDGKKSKHLKGHLGSRVSHVTFLGQRDISGPLGAERRRREARREMFTTPELVTAQRSILGPPAEGRPGPS